MALAVWKGSNWWVFILPKLIPSQMVRAVSGLVSAFMGFGKCRVVFIWFSPHNKGGVSAVTPKAFSDGYRGWYFWALACHRYGETGTKAAVSLKCVADFG